MAGAASPNVYKKLKDALKRIRQNEESFGCCFSMDPTIPSEIERRCTKINQIIERLYTDAGVTKANFKTWLGTDAESNTKPGKTRLVMLLSKLNKDLANEDFDILTINCKETDFIDMLNKQDDKTFTLSSTSDRKNEQSETAEEKKTTTSMAAISIEEETKSMTKTTSTSKTTSTKKKETKKEHTVSVMTSMHENSIEIVMFQG